MTKPLHNPCPMPTIFDNIWNYKQYYIGDVDEEERKNGMGENHWEGAESLEWYSGQFLRDTMHGVGEYRSRYRGDKGVFVSYEGHFYANRLHGYGAMSYPDGAVFTGLFYEDIRWGPGVLSQACLREDVGLWRGTQLVRLAWRPSTPNVALDLYSRPEGQACVNEHRIVLTTRIKSLNEVNSAIELLKELGAEPKKATEKWTKLYPKNCTDISSLLCHNKLFEDAYYKGGSNVLEEFTQNTNKEAGSLVSDTSSQLIYAWNNNEMNTHMMKHSYQHEYQRTGLLNINISHAISGPRTRFKQAGKQEIEGRTLLMASYLGHVRNVTELVNKCNVHPDIADIQGNTALMYAACGDQVDIVHFLVEAGANINNVNDNCCTPLGVCLLRYACAKKDIPASNMLQAILPPPAPLVLTEHPREWHMNRTTVPSSNLIPPNKILLSTVPSAIRQTKALLETTKVDVGTQKDEQEDSDGAYSEEKKAYLNINTEFSIKIKDLFSVTCALSPIPYFFEVPDMASTVDTSKEEPKPPEKNAKKLASAFKLQNGKGRVRPSQEVMWQNTERDEFGSLGSVEKIKLAAVLKIKLAILQLLNDGASPALVRCPQPALFIGIVSGCTEIVRYLVNYGADVNEVYPQKYYYTALDLAVSRPLTTETLELVRVLLECGAKADHRLCSEEDLQQLVIDPSLQTSRSGPNLLHVVLSRNVETSLEEELRNELLELLLDYNCNPMIQFEGLSATDIAMSKNMTIFDIFLKSPQTNLNAAINDEGQTVLVKMFSMPFCRTIPTAVRLQTIMNLLLFGADPFLECRSGENTYPNIFVFAQKVLTALTPAKPSTPISPPSDLRSKKKEAIEKKPRKDEKPKIAKKDEQKVTASDSTASSDYKQTLDLMAGCARLLYIRWIQAKLVRGLLDIIAKYKHRPWNMIMPEHKHKKACGLWLTAPRSLEIWNVLKPRKRKILNDSRVLNHLLCIISFYALRSKTGFRHKVTAKEKDMIDLKVKNLIKEQNSPGFTEELGPRPYVMPELIVGNDKKFAVCFECVQPFEEPEFTNPPIVKNLETNIARNIKCFNCKLVTFCNLNCMKINVEEHFVNHPCSDLLKQRYFPTPEESENELPMSIDLEAIKHKK